MGLLNDILYTNKTSKLAIKAMDVYAQRALMINSNIANVETPGYKAVDFKPFEEALKEAFKPAVGVSKTNEKHLDGHSGLENFKPEVEVSREPGRIDGNNVNLDKEIMNMSTNEMRYRAAITALKKRGQIIDSAIEQNR